MSSYENKPATESAIAFAANLREQLSAIDLGKYITIITPNGCKIALIWMVRGSVAFKISLYFLDMFGGDIRGQIQVNSHAEPSEKKKYWELMETLRVAGFRFKLDKPDTREFFRLDVQDRESATTKSIRIEVIHIQTAPIINAAQKFMDFVHLLCEFEKIELPTPRRSAVPVILPQKVATAPVATMPHPASEEWVLLPSQRNQLAQQVAPPQMVPQVAMFINGVLPPTQAASTTVDLEEQIKVLQTQLQALQIAKKREAFALQQKTELEAFERSLME
jgi:hypothetical protein